MISESYSEPINEFLKSYNPNKPTSFIIYLEANISYSHSMTQLFPFGLIRKNEFIRLSLRWINGL